MVRSQIRISNSHDDPNTIISSQRVGAKAPPDDRLREAIHFAEQRKKEWIASSLSLPCANASRLSRAMTLLQFQTCLRDLAAPAREFLLDVPPV
jgi:hypothetical protein